MRMKKLLLLLTGGTICSFPDSEGHRSSDAKMAAPLLVETLRNSRSAYKNYEIDVETVSNVLSENMTVEVWNSLLEKLRLIVENTPQEYAGILIAHGTDTLAYTAPLLDYLMTGSRIPVMLVSAQKPLTDSDSNGGNNFVESVEWILNRRVQDGCWVVYRNMDGTTYLHRGSHLLQSGDYSNDFYSIDKKQEAPVFHVNADLLKEYTGLEEPLIMELNASSFLQDGILKIMPYVGINYANYSLKNVKSVMHGLYHSATAPVERGDSCVLSFINKCKKQEVPFYIFPCKADDYGYVTTKAMLDAGAKPLYGPSENAAYVKLLLSQSLGLTPDQQDAFMQIDIADEMVHQ